MNILITAGGTTETIDGVRSITNTGTGRLGSLIADEFEKSPMINNIYYICAENSFEPAAKKAKIITIESVADLETAVINLFQNEKIDAVIHSMAVSDYRVKSVADISSVSRSLNKADCINNFSIEQAFDENNLIKQNKKISSSIESPIILLEKTPKILPMFKKLSPETILVGFKLLNNIDLNTLFNVAESLMNNNNCDFVLANDAVNIKSDIHKGFLLRKDGRKSEFSTKQEIAKGIVSAVMERIDNI